MNTLNTDSVCILMATSIRLESSLEKRLDALARRTGRTKAFYLRELIKNGIDELEDYYAASATMERVRKGEEKIYSADEVRRDLGGAPHTRFHGRAYSRRRQSSRFG
jgi:RHH-type rel operon transcriptional repressor/antitoxin RelB